MSGRPWPRFSEAYISGTESPIGKRSSLVGTPIPSTMYGTNAESRQYPLWHVAHVQRYPHTALLYLRNGLTDCVQIWYVSWGSLAKCLPQVIGGVHLHVRTCVPLSHKCSACRHSVTVGPIALKFGMHLETN